MVLTNGNLLSEWNDFLNCAYTNLAITFMKNILTLDMLKEGAEESNMWH